MNSYQLSAVSCQTNEKTKVRKLNVWHKAMDCIGKVYRVTEKFPAAELYGLTSQLRRAATSIALNIAEGSGASTDLEFKRFLRMALRSNYELMCGFEIANQLHYCPELEKENILEQSEELSAMISGLMKTLTAES